MRASNGNGTGTAHSADRALGRIDGRHEQASAFGASSQQTRASAAPSRSRLIRAGVPAALAVVAAGALAAQAAHAPAYSGLLERLLADLVAIVICSYLMYFRRHARSDLVMAYASFNVGLFVVVSVISVAHFSAAFGFGLFAMLSIIRLRSEPFSNSEVAYFFVSLVLGLINGIVDDKPLMLGILNVVVLATVYFADHPSLFEPHRRRLVTLDTIHDDDEAVRADIERRINVEVRSLTVLEVDFVREVTLVEIRYVDAPARVTQAQDGGWESVLSGGRT
jgi:hypothetical protein